MLTAVLGGAACVMEDFEELQRITKPDRIVAINDIGAELDHVDLWCTVHIEKMKMWLNRRADNGKTMAERIAFGVDVPNRFLTNYGYPPDRVLIAMDCGYRGGSGLFAAILAQKEFPGPVVLCGVPMEAVWSHFFDETPWYDAPHYRDGWAKNMDKLMPRVRSMSGWTARMLGRPDTSWITMKEKEANA